ncbi:MAG TPA: flagellar filament capping protein FliD [Sphingomicrobium sp.]|nr:flagellar filament capping protein FliD [Sphingomicrobium sp.]
MVTSIVSSLGGGSGLDVAKLVDDLANASLQPKEKLFSDRLKTVQAKISAVAQARSDLESFTKSLSDLVSGGSLQSQPVASDSSALGVTAETGARIGSLSSEVVIEQLAHSQTVYSDYVADAAAPIGQGSFTLSVGGTDFAIAVDASNDSLNGLADAINASGSGVTASVLTDSNGSRLVLKGESGAAKAFTLTTADPALQQFAYGGTGTMTLGQAAQDAKFTVDSVAFERDSNTVSDVLAGVTLTLKKAEPGEPITVSGERPTDSLRQTITDFVSVYNTLKQDISAARTATGSDSAIRTLDRHLSGLISTVLTSDPTIAKLTDIGISTNRDGSLSIDTAKLDAALKDHPDAVEALFSPTRDATHTATTDPGIGGVLQQLTDDATGKDGILETLRSRLDSESAGIAKDQQKMEDREAAYRDRLERQFGTLDSRLAALKATQSYLEQQVKIWTGGDD